MSDAGFHLHTHRQAHAHRSATMVRLVKGRNTFQSQRFRGRPTMSMYNPGQGSERIPQADEPQNHIICPAVSVGTGRIESCGVGVSRLATDSRPRSRPGNSLALRHLWRGKPWRSAGKLDSGNRHILGRPRCAAWPCPGVWLQVSRPRFQQSGTGAVQTGRKRDLR